jgi:hypothetical protein
MVGEIKEIFSLLEILLGNGIEELRDLGNLWKIRGSRNNGIYFR